jgi:hypothetical protein
VKLARVLARLALLSLAAAVFIVLTQGYAGSLRPPFMSPYRQAARRNRPAEPQGTRFPSFIGEVMALALIAAAGRIVFRLRLSPPVRGEEDVILLDLHREQ